MTRLPAPVRGLPLHQPTNSQWISDLYHERDVADLVRAVLLVMADYQMRGLETGAEGIIYDDEEVTGRGTCALQAVRNRWHWLTGIANGVNNGYFPWADRAVNGCWVRCRKHHNPDKFYLAHQLFSPEQIVEFNLAIAWFTEDSGNERHGSNRPNEFARWRQQPENAGLAGVMRQPAMTVRQANSATARERRLERRTWQGLTAGLRAIPGGIRMLIFTQFMPTVMAAARQANSTQPIEPTQRRPRGASVPIPALPDQTSFLGPELPANGQTG